MSKSKLPKWAPPPSLSCLTCKGVGHTEWCVLGTEHMQLIDTAKVARRFRPGETIYSQGEACHGVYCVEAGTVAMRMTNADGSSKILRVVNAGTTIGYADFFSGQGYRSSATALDQATVCHIPAEPLRQALSHNPALGLAFLNHGAEDLLHADAMNMQLALQTVRVRIAHLFLSLKDHHATAGPAGEIVLALPMSWQDAAELVGARPETVSRTVQSLVDDGVVSVAGHLVTIDDLDVLLDEIEATES